MAYLVKTNLFARGFDTNGKNETQILSAMVDLLGMNRSKSNKETARKIAVMS